MNFKCPQCGYKCNYNEIKADEDLTAIIKLIPVFGKSSSLVWAYAELFGATVHKTRVRKLRLILEEIAGLFQSNSFKFHKKVYRISREGIAEALHIVTHKYFETRLESHNYLKKVMIGIAEKEENAAGRKSEEILREKEAGLKHREWITEEQRQANLTRLGDIIKSM